MHVPLILTLILMIYSKNGENLLKIKSQHPCKYALKLLEKLFPVEERVGKCYRRGPRSANKPPLDEKRVKILEGKMLIIIIIIIRDHNYYNIHSFNRLYQI